MQDIEPEQGRDAEARLAGERLGTGNVGGAVEVEEGADAALGDLLPAQRRSEGDEIELAELFLERHSGEEVVDAPLVGFSRRRDAHSGNEQSAGGKPDHRNAEREPFHCKNSPDPRSARRPRPWSPAYFTFMPYRGASGGLGPDDQRFGSAPILQCGVSGANPALREKILRRVFAL
jgi:hypothetical protein